MAHEWHHLAAMLRDGYWFLHRDMDLAARILAELVCEQGCDPHGILAVAVDVCRKLFLLDATGNLLQEALALSSLQSPEVVEEQWCGFERDMDVLLQIPCARECHWDLSRRGWNKAVEWFLQATADLAGERDIHGQAMRALNGLRSSLPEGWLVPGLRFADRILVDERQIVQMPFDELRKLLEEHPFRVSRNARLATLCKGWFAFNTLQCRYVRDNHLGRHLISPSYRRLTSEEIVAALPIPSEYKETVLLRHKKWRYDDIRLDEIGYRSMLHSWERKPEYFAMVHTPYPASLGPPEQERDIHCYEAHSTRCKLMLARDITEEGSTGHSSIAALLDSLWSLSGLTPSSPQRSLTTYYAQFVSAVRALRHGARIDAQRRAFYLAVAEDKLERFGELSPLVTSIDVVQDARSRSLGLMKRAFDSVRKAH